MWAVFLLLIQLGHALHSSLEIERKQNPFHQIKRKIMHLLLSHKLKPSIYRFMHGHVNFPTETGQKEFSEVDKNKLISNSIKFIKSFYNEMKVRRKAKGLFDCKLSKVMMIRPAFFQSLVGPTICVFCIRSVFNFIFLYLFIFRFRFSQALIYPIWGCNVK